MITQLLPAGQASWQGAGRNGGKGEPVLVCHWADLPFLSIWLMQDEACSIPASDKCVHSHMHVDFHA